MAAIDKIYVNTWKEYIQFKEWCEQQPSLFDKYNKEVKLSNYLYEYTDGVDRCRPIFNAPYYVDAYVIKNCPFDFIQKELMINYGHWSQERIKDYYNNVINWNGEGDYPYWAKPEDFITLEDGTMTIKGLEESSYSKIKKGLLYNSPITNKEYIIGKHFKCIEHPLYMYNTPYKTKNWMISIRCPNYNIFWYHKNHNTWDDSEDFVDSDYTSSAAFCRTIKALKRLIIKWQLPVDTIVEATGRYYKDKYVFIVKK